MGRYGTHRSGPIWAESGTRNPYEALISALLKLASRDAQARPRRSAQHEDQSTPTRQDIADAQSFLLDTQRLAAWVELLDADVDRVQPALLQAAGLSLQKGQEHYGERAASPR